MSVDRTVVRNMATLARLELQEDQLERMVHDLNTILDHVDALAELEEGSGELETFTLQDTPSMRAGEEAERPPLGDVGGLAPAWKDGYFLVPPPPGIHAGEEDR